MAQARENPSAKLPLAAIRTLRSPSACPICATPLSPDILDISGESRLYGCPSCDVQVWEPRHTPGPEWYDESDHYLAFSVVNWLGWYQSYGLRSVPPNAGRLLDIGCADGRFVYAAAQRGLDAMGIDFSERLVDLGNRNHGANRLHRMTLEEYLAGNDHPVDVVTMFEVIEHVEEPLQFLEMAAKALRPGGTIIASTPNRLGYPKAPRQYDTPPHHLTRWSPDAFRAVARAAGLDQIHVDVCPPNIAIKAFLLDRFRLNIATRLLKARRHELRAGPSAAPQFRQTESAVRGMIKAKDVIADSIATAAAPLLGRWFPGPSMVLTAIRPN